MSYVEAPALAPNDRSFKLFLAGGITGCPDWQTEVVKSLYGSGITILNPRRSYFDVTDKRVTQDQIRWEAEHLRLADMIMFWFPEETLCPITLYELGAWSMTAKPLAIGCHPNYARAVDVVEQTAIARPDVTVRATLGGVIMDVVMYDFKVNHP